MIITRKQRNETFQQIYRYHYNFPPVKNTKLNNKTLKSHIHKMFMSLG